MTIENHELNDLLLFRLALGIIIFVLLISFVFRPVFASDSSAGNVFVYGPNADFSQVVLPNNSYVHQGENISRGNYYDLSGVYGFSGVLCWWKNMDDAGYAYPDKTFDLNNMNPRHVYIDSTWPVGRYYQFDGGTYNSDPNVITSTSFGKGNTYVFYVVDSASPIAPAPVVTVVKNDEITVNVGGNVTQVPVTYVEEIVITPAPTATPENQHTIVIPTTEQELPVVTGVVDKYGNPINDARGDIARVTPNTPISAAIPCIALSMIALYFGLRRKVR